MMLLRCPIIGDGLTTVTAFRPDVPKGLRWASARTEPDEGWAWIGVADDALLPLKATRTTRADLAVHVATIEPLIRLDAAD